MEKTNPTGLLEIQEIYNELSPLDKSREIYLLATLFREEIGLPQNWSYEIDQAQRNYARSIGDSINSAIHDTPDYYEIEDAIVNHVVGETQRRWMAYTEFIEGKDKVDAFVELLPHESAITCSLEDKAEQVRRSWRGYLKDFGLQGAELSPVVRAEFVRNKTMWDTAKESIFVRSVLTYELEDSIAA